MSYLPNQEPLTLFCYGFMLLLLYSFAGWCGEMVYCSVGQRHLCEKRGFLNGLLCPIYGHGALLVLWALHGGAENPFVTFVLGGILTSIVEYITSYAMEKLFHMRWWDYSKKFCNIHGRVCLQNSLIFGLACLVLCHVIHPKVAMWVGSFFRLTAAIPIAILCAILYLADIVLSVRSAIQIGNRVEKLHAVHDDLTEKLDALKAESQWVFQELRAEGIDALENLWAEGTDALDLRLAAAEAALEELKSKTSEAYLAMMDKRAETREAVDQKKLHLAEKRQARLEELSQLRDKLAERVQAAKQDSSRRADALYSGQDIFERRLMSSYPSLRSNRHDDALKKLRAYRSEAKQRRREKKQEKHSSNSQTSSGD